MKVKYIARIGLFLAGVFFALAVEAKAVNCLGEYYTSTGCSDCPNGLLICGKEQIFVNHNTSLKHIRVVVTRAEDGKQQTYLLENPPGRAFDYRSVQDNKWVQENIPGGLKFGDKIEVALKGGYGIDSSVSLYHDYESEIQRGPVGALKKLNRRPPKCWFTDKVNVITEEGQTQPVCQGLVKCRGIFTGSLTEVFPVACKALQGNQRCPTANHCVVSSKIKAKVADATGQIREHGKKIGTDFQRDVRNLGDRFKGLKGGSGSGSQ